MQVTLKKGEDVFRQGDEGDKFFIVLQARRGAAAAAPRRCPAGEGAVSLRLSEPSPPRRAGLGGRDPRRGFPRDVARRPDLWRAGCASRTFHCFSLGASGAPGSITVARL